MKIGFDIGGTNMRIAQVSAGGIGEVHKVPTSQKPEEALAVFVAKVREVVGGESVEGFAGGIPGVISGDGTIEEPSPHLPLWRGLPFSAQIREIFGVPCEIHNDAKMAALGEAVYGAGRGVQVVGYLGFGTGIGGGRIVNGKLDVGAYGFEPGHQILNAETSADFEQYASGAALQAKYGVHPVDLPRSAYDAIVPAVAAGIYNTIAHWSPEVLILGGSLVTGKNGFDIPQIVAALEALPPLFPQLPEIRKAELGDSMALHGARALSF